MYEIRDNQVFKDGVIESYGHPDSGSALHAIWVMGGSNPSHNYTLLSTGEVYCDQLLSRKDMMKRFGEEVGSKIFHFANHRCLFVKPKMEGPVPISQYSTLELIGRLQTYLDAGNVTKNTDIYAQVLEELRS